MRRGNTSSPHESVLLIHQLPPKPTNLRVRIWRKLQKLGAVAIKNSVYVLPANEKAHEDFQWLKQFILPGALIMIALSWVYVAYSGLPQASVAFLEHGAVEQHQWLTSSQLLDGVALSVATPGPFMLFATFVGFLAGGVTGARIATFFVFLPSFVFVLAGARYDEKSVSS